MLKEKYAGSERQFLYGAAGAVGSVESGTNHGDRWSDAAGDRGPRKHGTAVWGSAGGSVLHGLWRYFDRGEHASDAWSGLPYLVRERRQRRDGRGPRARGGGGG